MRQIFVFGSNRQGRHGKGAALAARTNYRAIYGQAEGLQGDSYAIITKELRSDFPPVTMYEVAVGIANMLEFAKNHPELEFMVTPIGCGLAGFKPIQIAIHLRVRPSNVRICTEFVTALDVLDGKSWIHVNSISQSPSAASTPEP